MKKLIKNLPDKPGVYIFFSGKAAKKRILYIGKATSIRSRVKSYFGKDLVLTRGGGIVKMVADATKVEFKTTGSVLEAIILEANLIKKYQPYYNVREKDDKSFNFVVITDERFPRVLTMRGKELLYKDSHSRHSVSGIQTPSVWNPKATFGPFPNGKELQTALRLVRKIFPYRGRKCIPCDEQKLKKLHSIVLKNDRMFELQCKPCFERQIGLCPGVCTGEISARSYVHTIRNITLLFESKTKALIKGLTREMTRSAKAENFENATKLRNQIFSLNHINDVSLIKGKINEIGKSDTDFPVEFRIEAYDISHISGKDTVGAMTVLEDGQPAKNEYRKFKIKGRFKDHAHDLANLSEILKRRTGHPEWSTPDLVVVDGGELHRSFSENLLQEAGWNVPVVSVVKDERHRPKGICGESKIVRDYRREILLANSEAHRFALSFHRTRRDKMVK